MFDKDFRLSDTVCVCEIGDGEVSLIADHETYPVKVTFKNKYECYYTRDGKRLVNHEYPSLFHGTHAQVFGNLPDLHPERKVTKWINLCYNPEVNHRWWEDFNSVEEAILDASSNRYVIVKAIKVEVLEKEVKQEN